MTDKLKVQAILREFMEKMVQKYGLSVKELLNAEIFKLNKQKKVIDN
jgi:hypothetical protein